MKQTATLIFLLIFGFLSLQGTENTRERVPEKEETTCTCDVDRDLEVLKALYNQNGGANWNFAADAFYVDLLRRASNNGFFPVPNAGTAWDINNPNAQNLMGTWHGVETDQFGCVANYVP